MRMLQRKTCGSPGHSRIATLYNCSHTIERQFRQLSWNVRYGDGDGVPLGAHGGPLPRGQRQAGGAAPASAIVGAWLQIGSMGWARAARRPVPPPPPPSSHTGPPDHHPPPWPPSDLQARGAATGGGAAVAPATQQPGLRFGRGERGAWDEAGVAHPVVRFSGDGDQCRWFMWYSGRSAGCKDMDDLFPSSGSVGVAVSSDGVHWQRGAERIAGARGADKAADVGKVLEPNKDWWWHDTCHLHAADVQLLANASPGGASGVYWMFYSGGSFEEVELPPGLSSAPPPVASFSDEGDAGVPSTSVSGSSGGATLVEGLRTRPGLAFSQDGRNWARIEAGHHTGALFDVGEAGQWDELFVGAPQVVAAGPRDMRMFYHSWDPRRRKYLVGLATSPDGFSWEKQGPVFEVRVLEVAVGQGCTGRARVLGSCWWAACMKEGCAAQQAVICCHGPAGCRA